MTPDGTVVEIELWQEDEPELDRRFRWLIAEFSVRDFPEDETGKLRMLIHWSDGTSDHLELPIVAAPEFGQAITRLAYEAHARAQFAQIR